MAQTARPSADTDAGSWTTTPLWSRIDDAVGSGDADNIEIDRSTNGARIVGLAAISQPDTGTMTARIRAKKHAAAGNARTIAFSLRHGTTEIGALSAQTLTETYQTFTINPTDPGGVNWADLNVVITAGGTVTGSGANRRDVLVADFEFETPDAAAENHSGTAAGALPAYTGTATGTPNVNGTAAGVLPAYTGTAAGTVPGDDFSGEAHGVMPAMTGTATGAAVMDEPQAPPEPVLTAEQIALIEERERRQAEARREIQQRHVPPVLLILFDDLPRESRRPRPRPRRRR